MDLPHTHAGGKDTAAYIDRLLAASLGAISLSGAVATPQHGWSPTWVGLLLGAAYAVAFGVPLALMGTPSALMELTLWGACYLAVATCAARYTSASVLQLITERICPNLTDATLGRIHDDLTARFEPGRLTVLALGAAALATAAAALAVSRDVEAASVPQILWWSAGFFFLCFLGARTTAVARFYGSFAAKVTEDEIYALDPAHTAAIRTIAGVGARILVFWTIILLSVLTLVTFFGELRWFTLFVVPVASFFSLIFGTLVFLRSERQIQRVVGKVAAATLRRVEREASGLLNGRVDDSAWPRLMTLAAAHRQISNAGEYRSLLKRTASVLVPVVPSLITVATRWSELEATLAKLW